MGNSKLADTFYWFDYETFGTDPAFDRASQFAGQRTDQELNPIGKPLVIYNRLTEDYLPDPVACSITGIGPAIVASEGLPEAKFIDLIRHELSTPGTCNVGYNNIRFDDEFTRYTLFRNFFDPYEHEWKHRNSRWDMLDIVRLTRALRPDGIEWPLHDDGSASNRLEDLTTANGIQHTQAHDALSDVHATIAVAGLIRSKQKKLFDYMLDTKSKDKCRTLLNVKQPQAIVHVSGKIPSAFHHLAVVAPLANHPVNSNGVIVLNLHQNPAELLDLAEQGEAGVEAIAARLFTRNEDLAEGVSRLPLKTIHVNRTPVLTPLAVVRSEDAERLQIDLAACQRNLEVIKTLPADQGVKFRKAVAAAMQLHNFRDPADIDASLYSGAFFSQQDRDLFTAVRASDVSELNAFTNRFEDERANEMLFRYRARNYPESLSSEELDSWYKHCQSHLTGEETGERATYPRTLSSFRESVKAVSSEEKIDQVLTQELLDYAKDLEKKVFQGR